MFYTIFNGIKTVISEIPFSSQTWFVLMILAVIWYLFAKASKDPKSPIMWEDLLVDATTSKVSPYKLGYMIGVIVATWIVIMFADTGKLTYDIFGLYLTYLLGGAGWAALLRQRQDSMQYNNGGYNNFGGLNGVNNRFNGGMNNGGPNGQDDPDVNGSENGQVQVDPSGHIR